MEADRITSPEIFPSPLEGEGCEGFAKRQLSLAVAG